MRVIITILLTLSTITIYTSCRTATVTAMESIQLGDQANNENRYDDAVFHYEKYLAVSPELGLYRDVAEEAEVSRKLAHVYSTQGKFDRAIDCLKKAIYMDSVSTSGELELIEDHRQLGVVFAYKGEYPKALHHLDYARKLGDGMDRSLKDVKRKSVAETYLALAQLHLSLGNYPDAEKYSWGGLALYERIPQGEEGMAEARLVLGIVSREKNQLELAEKFLNLSADICSRYGFNAARQHQALGEVCLLKGDVEAAVRYKLEALDQALKTNIKPQIIIANMRLGDVYQQLGDQKKADTFYQKALAIQSEGGSDVSALSSSLKVRLGDVRGALDYHTRSGSMLGTALVCMRLGERKLQENDLDSAAYFGEKAFELFEQMGNNEGAANAAVGLSKVYFGKGDFERAVALLKRAKKLSIQPDLHWQVSFRLGMIDEKLGNIDSARAGYDKAIGIINEMRGNLTIEEFKTLFADTKVEVYDRMIQLLLKNKKRWRDANVEEDALYLSEQSRSRAFLDMMGNKKIVSKVSVDSTMLDKEQHLRLKLQRLTRELSLVKENALRRQLMSDLHTSQEAHQTVIQQIKLNNPAYATVVHVDPVKTPSIQKLINAKSAVLEYWVGEESTVIWVITKNKTTSAVIDISKKALQREVQGCRSGISHHARDVYNASSKKLYDLLIRPVLPELNGITNLILVPHTTLHFLPFQALQSPRNRFLIEDFVISYAPSLSVLYYCMTREPALDENVLALALGNEAIGDHSALPGTEIEVKQLSRLYGDARFENHYGKAFTETLFKNESNRYGYLHLATHGVFNSHQPLYSYILMYPSEVDDGRLTVDEIFSIDIKGKLVALSACETALGDIGRGDELVGLSRAFIYAGAPAVIVSLWKVEDATTAWLMTRFHQYLISGSGIAESLTYAQRDLINRKFEGTGSSSRGLKDVIYDDHILKSLQNQKTQSYRDPLYWAPFIVIGSGE